MGLMLITHMYFLALRDLFYNLISHVFKAALASLAKLLVRMTKNSEAVDVLKSKIRGRFEVEGGEFSEVMASDHNLIANIFLAGGDIQRAAAHLKKCVDIRKVVLGPNHRKTRETLAAISSISH